MDVGVGEVGCHGVRGGGGGRGRAGLVPDGEEGEVREVGDVGEGRCEVSVDVEMAEVRAEGAEGERAQLVAAEPQGLQSGMRFAGGLAWESVDVVVVYTGQPAALCWCKERYAPRFSEHSPGS